MRLGSEPSCRDNTCHFAYLLPSSRIKIQFYPAHTDGRYIFIAYNAARPCGQAPQNILSNLLFQVYGMKESNSCNHNDSLVDISKR